MTAKPKTVRQIPAEKAGPPSDLPGLGHVAPPAWRLEAHATASDLFPITQLTDSDLRNLGNKFRPDGVTPWIPKPVRGKYPTIETLRGWADYVANRTERQSGFPVYPTMDAAAAAFGCSKDFLRGLKKAGCPGFDPSGRFYTAQFLAGLETFLAGKSENDRFRLQAEGVSTWNEFTEKYRGLNEKTKHEEITGELISKSTVAEGLQLLEAIYFNGLDRQKLDFPANLAGRSAEKIKASVDKYNDQLREKVAGQIDVILSKAEAQVTAALNQPELKAA